MRKDCCCQTVDNENSFKDPKILALSHDDKWDCQCLATMSFIPKCSSFPSCSTWATGAWSPLPLQCLPCVHHSGGQRTVTGHVGHAQRTRSVRNEGGTGMMQLYKINKEQIMSALTQLVARLRINASFNKNSTYFLLVSTYAFSRSNLLG